MPVRNLWPGDVFGLLCILGLYLLVGAFVIRHFYAH
jgi:hypothetical protein